jgi:hypothetical protein
MIKVSDILGSESDSGLQSFDRNIEDFIASKSKVVRSKKNVMGGE